jgi:hypothetical protein
MPNIDRHEERPADRGGSEQQQEIPHPIEGAAESKAMQQLHGEHGGGRLRDGAEQHAKPTLMTDPLPDDYVAHEQRRPEARATHQQPGDGHAAGNPWNRGGPRERDIQRGDFPHKPQTEYRSRGIRDRQQENLRQPGRRQGCGRIRAPGRIRGERSRIIRRSPRLIRRSPRLIVEA